MVYIKKNILLKDFSNYRIGGRAKYFLEISNLPELKEGLAKWKKISKILPIFILGGGTNLLIDDRGFSGLVIHNNIKDIKILEGKDIKILSEKDIKRTKKEATNISVFQYPSIYVSIGGGVLMEDLLAFCIENSLSGLEWAGGLPGTLGGAVRGNAGAFRGEIKDNVYEVESLNIKNLISTYEVDDTATSEVRKRKNAECKFGYRTSIFKTNPNEIIISSTLKLQKGDKKLIQEKIEEKINYRRQRHPLDYPNIGSIFKNIPARKVPQKLLEQLKDSIKDDPFPILPTAKLLAIAGLKGKKVGGAAVSQKHPNFIVNFNNASSKDVKTLIYKIKKIIKDKYAITLEEEITII